MGGGFETFNYVWPNIPNINIAIISYVTSIKSIDVLPSKNQALRNTVHIKVS